MAVGGDQACFVIADLSGYTGYLTETELDHAQDVLADLLETTIGALGPVLRLAKLEGDAVFLYAPAGTVDGSILLDTVEHAYFAFRRRLRSIRQASTCQCNACRLIPALNLKYCVHHGPFARQRILGQEELAGPAVILVHRLLKNSVSERHGLHGYALLSEAAVQALHLDPAALGLRRHTEAYEHIGAVAVYLHDLEARWRQEAAARRIVIRPEEAHEVFVDTFPAPLPLVWEWMTDATRRVRWGQGVTAVDVATPGGRRGVGTVNHCMHGPEAIVEEILEWHPVDSFTYRIRLAEGSEVTSTVAFRPTPDGGTAVTEAWRFESEALRATVWPTMRETFRGWMRLSYARLTELLREELARRQEAFAQAEAVRGHLQQAAAHYWEDRASWVTVTPGG